MTATEASVTALPDELVREVEARYRIGRIEAHRRLAGGYANDVWRVDSSVGPLVLRVKHPPSDPGSIAWEHGVVARLARELPEVLAPLAGRDGSTFFLYRGDAVSLLPFAGGEPADRGSERHRLAAAALLGRLHAVTVRVDLPERPGIEGLRQLRSLDSRPLPSAWRADVERHRADALTLLAQLESRRPLEGVLHGDFFPGNVLLRDGGAVALVDWEEAHVGWLVFELANGVWEFAKSKITHDLDRGAAARFIAAYRDAGGAAPPEEDDLLLPLIRAKRVLELLRAPTDRQVDWEYQRHNLRALEKLRG